MRQKYAVELADPDDSFEVTVDGRDVRAWEAAHDESYYQSTTTLIQVTQLVHLAAVRTATFTGDWAAFDARCTGVTVVRDPSREEPPARTRRGPTDGSSVGSRSGSASSPRSSKRKGTPS